MKPIALEEGGIKMARCGNGQNGNRFHKKYKSFETCNFLRKFEKITNKFVFLCLENLWMRYIILYWIA
ncbi:hypothetical protein TNIN_483241 [Trichonephila inaurata madagascariensis]|uniref:Uncharacterized protein n=1 Tax=Trichonephila inaurata madagascariensis TaxID=2747483 RepID=A0A8X6IZ74_9ARAC|nr:hypothetical protein TNIN_483241 [Trichonephila inaurata madagascariensis]